MVHTRSITGVLAAAAIVVTSGALLAQKVVKTTPGKAGSPHETVEWKIDGAALQMEYGRPYIKGRPLSAVAPEGEAYRLGADEATVLTTDKPLMVGSLMLQPGKYSLWAVPQKGKWQLVVNKETGQWGTNYDAKQDLGRTPLKAEKAPKANEQFTISITDTPAGGVLAFQWGTEKLSAEIMVH
jgi:hypothetical protein